MTKIHTISENISAFIDGELSPKDIQSVESKINSSLELKNEHDALMRIKKLTAASFKQIDESPYFETRLAVSLIEENNIGAKLKRWSPALIIGSLTIALMIFLKFNPNIIENLFEQQKSKIAGFYKENLKPLLFAADVSGDDIFDFAFYSQLPLDKSQGQYLLFGYDDKGNGVFEIKTLNENQQNLDLQKFKSALELTPKQSEQIDSIIQVYATAIEPLILVNDKNTVAVNPGLWSYQKAMLADILSFAENSNKQKFRDVMPAGFSFASNNEVAGLVAQVKNLHDNNYIFLTPDSIFSEKFKFDQDEFNKKIENLNRDLNNHKKNAEVFKSFTFRFDSSLHNFNSDGKFDNEIMVYIDSNECRVHIPKIQIPEISLPNFDSLNSLIKDAMKNFQNFSFVLPEIPEIQGNHFEFKFQDSDSLGKMNFDINIPNVDSILRENKIFFDSTNSFDSRNFQFQDKSLENLLKQFYKNYGDENSQGGSMKEQFESLQKEMENLRREMEEWRNKLEQKKTNPEAEVIEI
jgi:hypothetical protein